MSSSATEHLPFKQVAIIGAGIGGIDVGCALKRKLSFHDFVIYDRNSGIGGTWHENDYPGCAVDIPGCIYQLSYAPEPNFPRAFPSRAEMRAYLLRVADKYRIHQHIQLNTLWKESTWLEDRQIWRTELENVMSGDRFVQESKVLVGAIGHQVDPKDFEPSGKEKFQGLIVPACKYPAAGLDLKGKEVVVLGNGGTAVQVVPGILKEVKKCTQIQREPHWILHRPNPRVPEGFRQFLTAFPFCFRLLQYLVFALVESFYAVLGGQLAGIAKRHLKSCKVPEKYHPLLTPSYTPGCKRLVFAAEYLQCLKNPKVELVQDEITSLTESKVVTKSGREHYANVIILCHGFKGDTFYYPLKGRNGITPPQHWDAAGGPSCYKGCAMTGFPNFFSIRGPNVSSGQQSVIWFIEASSALVMNAAKPVILGTADAVEVEANAELSYTRDVQAACKRGHWGRDCHTYYVTPDGWNHTIYPWTTYWLWFHRFINRDHWIISTATRS